MWIPTGTEFEPLIYLLKVLSTVWLFREKRHLCDTNKESQDLLADWSIKWRRTRDQSKKSLTTAQLQFSNLLQLWLELLGSFVEESSAIGSVNEVPLPYY